MPDSARRTHSCLRAAGRNITLGSTAATSSSRSEPSGAGRDRNSCAVEVAHRGLHWMAQSRAQGHTMACMSRLMSPGRRRMTDSSMLSWASHIKCVVRNGLAVSACARCQQHNISCTSNTQSQTSTCSAYASGSSLLHAARSPVSRCFFAGCWGEGVITAL